MKVVKPIVDLLHDYLAMVLKKGDSVIDATAGNGNDTLFLCELVGATGHVYGFDIQNIAITNTAKLLKEHGIHTGFHLFCDNYKNMADCVPDGIDAVVFNLGYLPKGNHEILSSPKDTVIAVAEGMNLLKSGGLLLIAVYWGHENGAEEKSAIEELLLQPQYKTWGIYKISVPNRNKAPELIIIEKP